MGRKPRTTQIARPKRDANNELNISLTLLPAR